MARVELKVIPGASRDGIAGWLGHALKVKVRVPPERGKANKAVEALLARALDVSMESVTIIKGHTSSRKLADIAGLTESEVRDRIAR